MNKTNALFTRHILLYGLLGGVLQSCFFIILSLIYENPLGAGLKSFDFFIFIAVLAWSAYRLRQAVLPSEGLNFSQGFLATLLTAFLMTAFAVFYLWIDLTFIHPHFFERYIRDVVKQLSNPELNSEAYGGEAVLLQIITDLKTADVYKLLWLEIRQKSVLTLFAALLLGGTVRKSMPLA